MLMSKILKPHKSAVMSFSHSSKKNKNTLRQMNRTYAKKPGFDSKSLFLTHITLYIICPKSAVLVNQPTSFPNLSSLLNQKFLLLKYLIFPEITALSEFELLELFLQTFCEFDVKFVLLLVPVQFLFLAFNRTPRFTNNTYVVHFFMFYQLIWLKF